MYKETKELYKEIELFIENQKFNAIRIFGMNSGDETKVLYFWSMFMKNKKKLFFYKMISDPHWKYVPFYSYSKPNSLKAQTSVFIRVLCASISQDISKSRRALRSAEGLWLAALMFSVGVKKLSRKSLLSISESNDPRAYKEALKLLPNNHLNKIVMSGKANAAKREYISKLIEKRKSRDLCCISSWNKVDAIWTSVTMINESNAKKVMTFIKDNHSEITRNFKEWDFRYFNRALSEILRLIDTKDIFMFANMNGFSKVIKARSILSDII